MSSKLHSQKEWYSRCLSWKLPLNHAIQQTCSWWYPPFSQRISQVHDWIRHTWHIPHGIQNRPHPGFRQWTMPVWIWSCSTKEKQKNGSLKANECQLWTWTSFSRHAKISTKAIYDCCWAISSVFDPTNQRSIYRSIAKHILLFATQQCTRLPRITCKIRILWCCVVQQPKTHISHWFKKRPSTRF